MEKQIKENVVKAGKELEKLESLQRQFSKAKEILSFHLKIKRIYSELLCMKDDLF